MQIEFAVLNALFQESGKGFLPNTKAFLHDGPTEPRIRFKGLMAARGPVDDVGTCAVLSHDCPQDSFCGRPFRRRGGLGNRRIVDTDRHSGLGGRLCACEEH